MHLCLLNFNLQGLYEQLVDYIETHQSCQWDSSVEILASLIGLIQLNRMFSQDFSTTTPADAMDEMIVKSFEHVSKFRVTEENFMSSLEALEKCCGGDEKWRRWGSKCTIVATLSPSLAALFIGNIMLLYINIEPCTN